MRASLVLVGFTGVLLSLAEARAEGPRGYVCARATGPITIDGKLDEPAWQQARWSDDFVDIEGDVRPQPRFHTRVKMAWDDNYFYIAAQLDEPHVWGTLTKHDSVIFHDNDFEVFIDPDGDNHQYYELEINALNTEWDLRLVKPYRDGGPALNEWEVPGLKTATHVHGTLNDPSDVDTGWTVELALPWKALAEFANRPAPPRDGDQWRVNFSRVEWQHELAGGRYRKVPNTREDNWVWSPQGAIDMHRPEMWGYVQFSTARPGEAAFRPDRARAARELLMQVYHAERAYQKAHRQWTTRLEDLGIKAPQDARLAGPVTIDTRGDGYVATAELKPSADGPAERWHVRQDSRIWSD